MLGSLMGPLAPGIVVPEELLEVRSMLATRAENWKQQWLQEGEQRGRREGEAALLVRQLERRFVYCPAGPERSHRHRRHRRPERMGRACP